MWDNPRVITQKKLDVTGKWQALLTQGTVRMVAPSMLMGNS